MFPIGQQFTDVHMVYVLDRFGADEYGAFAVLEWNDVPLEMQRRYEVPLAMIVRANTPSQLGAL